MIIPVLALILLSGTPGNEGDKILKGSPSYFEMIEGRSLGDNTLDFIHLNLPPVCNYNCVKCSTKNTPREVGTALSLDETRDLLTEGKELGALSLAISGEGEPLAYRHFFDIIEHADSLGLVSVIATNGSLLDDDKVQFLYDHNATVMVSLDTLRKEKYEEQCRVSNKFDRVLGNIDSIKEIYGSGYCKNGRLEKIYRAGIHTVVNSENTEELPDLRDFCGDGLFFSAAYIANRGNVSRNQHLIRDYEQIRKEAEEAGEAFLICQSQQGFPVCGFFYYGLTVGYDGEVLLADHALETAGLVGNVRDESLKNLRGRAFGYIKSFYENGGSCYCIVRDPALNEFVGRCKNER